MQVVISFDTTGSMFPVLSEVRNKIHKLINEFKNIINLEIAIIAHGDYYDKDNPYTIKYIDFTNNFNELSNFVNNVESTHGGDAPECYELVLYTVYQNLSWKSDHEKIFIMIGDDVPHEPNYPQNTLKIDWRKELELIDTLDIKIYAVHALSNYRQHTTYFYKTCANKTNGFYFTLNEFQNITHLIIGACYQAYDEHKLNEYIERIDIKSIDLKRNFAKLKYEEFNDTAYNKAVLIFEKEGLHPIPPGRFQVFKVDKNVSISTFVRDRGLEFKQGRGFYEFTKREEVQPYKEIILRDKETGVFFNGADARKLLGLKPQTVRDRHKSISEKISPKNFDRFDVFIQSTSNNRKLIGDTEFLYEINDYMSEEVKTSDINVHDIPAISDILEPKEPKKPEKIVDLKSVKIKKENKEIEEDTEIRFIEFIEIDNTIINLNNVESIRLIKNYLAIEMTNCKEFEFESEKKAKEAYDKLKEILSVATFKLK